MTIGEQIWCPAIELHQTDTALILKAEVPGIELKDLNVHAEVDSLAIAGIHPRHEEQIGEEIIPSQLHYGQVYCNVPLPVPIEIKKVKAELIDGVLTVVMPKIRESVVKA
jgi:HSP20 family protein